MEAVFPLPEAMPASPHTFLGELPPPGPPPGSAGRATAEDVQGYAESLRTAVAREASVSLQPRTSFGLNTKALAVKTVFLFCLFIEGQNV